VRRRTGGANPDSQGESLVPQPRATVPDSGAIRPGLNSTGSTIPKYRLVKKATTAVDAITPAVDAATPIFGVTMEAVLDGKTGDTQVHGSAIVEASAAIAIGAKVTAAAGGKGVTAGAAAYYIGTAASAASANGDLFEVHIAPGTSPA
jgi:hypothetical protein